MQDSAINRKSYNLVAANYAQEHGESLAWKPELEKFIGYLPLPEVVIDLGCGHGDETVYLAEHVPTAKVIGVDFAEQMIHLAIAKKSSAEFVTADIARYKPELKVQGIWARASLHHLNDRQLQMLFKTIGSYGDASLVIAMINKVGEGEEIEEKQKYGTRLVRYFNYFSPHKVETIAKDYGYSILEQYVKEEGGHQFLVTYLKRRILAT